MAAGIAADVLGDADAVGVADAPAQPIVAIANRLVGDDCQAQLAAAVVVEGVASALSEEAV